MMRSARVDRGLVRSGSSALALVAVVFAADCTKETSNPCDGVACSGHGICFTNGSVAFCACFPGFAPLGHECLDQVSCQDVPCSLHGQCVEVDGFATGCRCDPGFAPSPDGYYCFLDTGSGGDADADADADADTDGDADAEIYCLQPSDCTDPARSVCDLDRRECIPCADRSDCAHLTGLPVCHDGRCVQCTETDDGACTEDAPICHENACVQCTAPDPSACVAQGLVCDDSTHSCVQCTAADPSACTATAPRCDPETHGCVGCTGPADCVVHAGTPECDADSGHCVECLEPSQCVAVEASRCDLETHDCVRCLSDEDCAHLPSTPACRDGTCVECTRIEHCPPGSHCNYLTSRCFDACQPCGLESGCDEGLACSEDFVGSMRCLPLVPTSGCERPWQPRRIGLDGETVCGPPETTSCAGVMAYDDDCEESHECSFSVSDDATCTPADRCTYGCLSEGSFIDEWCPAGILCDIGTGLCELPP